MDDQSKITVLITGVSGFIGQKLAKLLIEKGYKVHGLITDEKEKIGVQGVRTFVWDTNKKKIDPAAMKNVSWIINLAGKTINSRWNEKNKKAIINSRVNSSETLYRYLSENDHKVQHITSASAVGFYPSDFKKLYAEGDDNVNSNFLGKVCKVWEENNLKFEKLGIRSSILRFGLICDSKQGALKPMVTTIKNYVGSPLGSGKQWYSWIHVKDVLRMITFTFENQIKGIYNCVAPNPLRQEDFTKQLAKQLERPIMFPPVPTFLLRVVLGERHVLVTDSQKVSCEAIEKEGFQFDFPLFKDMLSDLFPKSGQ